MQYYYSILKGDLPGILYIQYILYIIRIFTVI